MKMEDINLEEFETMGAGDPEKEELEAEIYGKTNGQ